MKRAKTRHALTAIYALVTLLVGAVSVPTASAEDKEYTRPKLVWERTFDQWVLAAGVDKDCYRQSEQNIGGCLKWMTAGRNELRWFVENGKLAPEPLKGMIFSTGISANDKYLVLVQKKGSNGPCHMVFDWNGNKIWETDEKYLFPYVRNDGSAVFLRNAVGLKSLYGFNSYDAQGWLTNTYEFPEERSFYWVGGFAISDSFFALLTVPPGGGLELCVFDEDGRVAWKQKRIGGSALKAQGTGMAKDWERVTVSNRGEVLVLVGYNEPYGTYVFIYDHRGALRDTLLLDPTGASKRLKTYGRFAFVSAQQSGKNRGLFLCYDFENMAVKSLLQEEVGLSFGNFDVDLDAGLVAVAVHSRDRGHVVKIYDLDGVYKTEVEIEVGYRDRLWLRMLVGALLVAEKNKLRLYEIDVE
ncbi:hypothetical protein E3J62_12600 [candidate division TA06 bacterium]|uniref:WD40 repeat domain-containing protein n=1 Tax=candidate division TA06 bacterium TaxID=2250710 RepID=A0A523UMD3_UNCT6|nr:MAG: hypothetical protein E3J62_12600 [candidate division TA06 bacterium]